jgi:hypothetical protein
MEKCFCPFSHTQVLHKLALFFLRELAILSQPKCDKIKAVRIHIGVIGNAE